MDYEELIRELEHNLEETKKSLRNSTVSLVISITIALLNIALLCLTVLQLR